MPTRSILFRLALPCAILATTASFATMARAVTSEMSFRVMRSSDAEACEDRCPLRVVATGRITDASPSRFLEAVAGAGGGPNRQTVVYLDSPGGGVAASMLLGDAFRRVDATAIVADVSPDGEGGAVVTNAGCYSACVYALMGARERIVPRASQVGIHRMFADMVDVDASGAVAGVERLYDDGDMRGMLMAYSARMGVDPALIATAEHVASDRIHILTRREIERWHLAVPLPRETPSTAGRIALSP